MPNNIIFICIYLVIIYISITKGKKGFLRFFTIIYFVLLEILIVLTFLGFNIRMMILSLFPLLPPERSLDYTLTGAVIFFMLIPFSLCLALIFNT
jgi:hypothetical protein